VLSTCAWDNEASAYLLHEGVRDGHARELGTAPVRPLLAVTTQPRDLGQVQVELLDEPVDGIARLVCQDLDEIVAGQLSRRLFGVSEAARQS